jgi:hypothetical protein
VQFAKAGAAEPAALDLHQRTANSLRRLLETLGIKRVPREVIRLGQILQVGHDPHSAWSNDYDCCGTQPSG